MGRRDGFGETRDALTMGPLVQADQMTTRHDEVVTAPQIPRWIGTQPLGAPGRGGSVYGDGPAHIAGGSRCGSRSDSVEGQIWSAALGPAGREV